MGRIVMIGMGSRLGAWRGAREVIMTAVSDVCLMRGGLRRLSNEALVRRMDELMRVERASMAEFLELLGEVDARRLYRLAASPSLFQWLIDRWGLSEASAYKRIAVARKGRDVPALIEAIRAGRMHLAGAAAIAPHIGGHLGEGLVVEASGKSKREVAMIVARHLAARNVDALPIARADSVRFVRSGEVRSGEPARALLGASAGQVGRVGDGCVGDGEVADRREALPTGPCVDVVGDLPESREGVHEAGNHGESPSRELVRAGAACPAPAIEARVGVSLSSDVYAMLEELLKSYPGASIADVISKAIKSLHARKYSLAKAERVVARTQTRGGPVAQESPPATAQSPKSRRETIPSTTRAQVWLRDQGRCTYIGDDGTRCTATHRLELDHVRAVAHGGDNDPSNLRLRCPLHNQLAAIQTFGEQFMSQWIG